MKSVEIRPHKYIDTSCIHCQKPEGLIDRWKVRDEVMKPVKFSAVNEVSAWINSEFHRQAKNRLTG